MKIVFYFQGIIPFDKCFCLFQLGFAYAIEFSELLQNYFLCLSYVFPVQADKNREISIINFAVFVSLDRKNIGKAKEIILQQFRKLNSISKTELEEAKTFIEGNYALEIEDNFHSADNLAFWETIKNASLADNYIKSIKKVSLNDVKRVAGKYLNKFYTLVVI